MNEINELLIEENFLDSILNYDILKIDDSTRFWMIRTKKGYFYNEFIKNNFIALAWNIIDSTTNFSESNIENLKDSILINYSEIKRPTTVINKCKSFINDVKPGDYIVIPSLGSEFITIAKAGDYYEERSKTYEIEKEIISRIENNDVLIDDVACPYKKRRKITPILTVRSSSINARLFKAITNYHGISSLDEYWRSILSLLYQSYIFKNNLNIVYYINRKEPIGPRKLSQLLLASTDCWCNVVDDENKISAQVNVSSPGPVDFSIVDSIPDIIEGAKIVAGLTVGILSAVKPDAIPGFIKNIISLPATINREYIAAKRESLMYDKEREQQDIELEEKRLNNLSKKIEILEKLKEFGADPNEILNSALFLTETFEYLKVGKLQESSTYYQTEEGKMDDSSDNEIAEEETI